MKMKIYNKCPYVTFGRVSVWAVDDKWLSVPYKLNFVFSSADVLF